MSRSRKSPSDLAPELMTREPPASTARRIDLESRPSADPSGVTSRATPAVRLQRIHPSTKSADELEEGWERLRCPTNQGVRAVRCFRWESGGPFRLGDARSTR